MSNFVKTRYRRLEALAECPTLEQGQHIVKVTQAQGENIYEAQDQHGEKFLYRLPKRLRHVVYIRRGSFLFVRDQTNQASSKIRGEIEVVVMDSYLRALQKESFWPVAFKAEDAMDDEKEKSSKDEAEGENEMDDDSDDGSWEAGMGNPNRPKWECSEDEDSSDEN